MSGANAEIKSTHRLWENWVQANYTLHLFFTFSLLCSDYVADLIKRTGIVFNRFTKDKIWACPNKQGFPQVLKTCAGDVPLPLPIAEFPTGVEDMGGTVPLHWGGPSKFNGGGLIQYMGGAFSRNHFMEGCFTFQWGGFVFQMGGEGFILKGGRPIGGASILMGFFGKDHKMGAPPPFRPHYGKPCIRGGGSSKFDGGGAA